MKGTVAVKGISSIEVHSSGTPIKTFDSERNKKTIVGMISGKNGVNIREGLTEYPCIYFMEDYSGEVFEPEFKIEKGRCELFSVFITKKQESKK